MERKELIRQHFSDYVQDLSTLIAIDSTNKETSGNMPFGEGIQKALEQMLALSKKMGFETFIDPNGYYGYAQIGEGKSLFGVLGHLDVVPPGDRGAWNSDPFQLVEKDGKIFGRGVQDDKGPTLAAMYALKLLLDSGKKLNQRVRFIFGTDEESLWRCMAAYTKKEEIPSAGFTPDSTFPLTYAEKGLIEYNLISDHPSDIVFTGGDAYNAVPSRASIHDDAAIEESLKKLGYEYKVNREDIDVIGKSVHAQAADTGINAITRLAEALQQAGRSNDMIRFMVEKGLNPHGIPIFGEVSDEHSGKLMFNIGKASFTKDKQILGIDIRFPVTFEKEKVDQMLESACKPYGIRVEQYDYLKSIFIDQKSDLIQKLMKAYQDVTGDMESKPKSSGGATYARAMNNVVAFGSILPQGKKTEHQPNECVEMDQMKIAMEIYMRAFELLVVKE